MQNNGIEMTVHVNGRSVKEYTHQGMSFIEARDGTNYTIKLKNNLGQRAMAVVSVDGLDVVSGKNAESATMTLLHLCLQIKARVMYKM
jgi:hypothetical protein